MADLEGTCAVSEVHCIASCTDCCTELVGKSLHVVVEAFCGADTAATGYHYLRLGEVRPIAGGVFDALRNADAASNGGIRQSHGTYINIVLVCCLCLCGFDDTVTKNNNWIAATDLGSDITLRAKDGMRDVREIGEGDSIGG